jgi:hypothetical protein
VLAFIDIESLRSAIRMNFCHVAEHTSAGLALSEVLIQLLPFGSRDLTGSRNNAELLKLFVA